MNHMSYSARGNAPEAEASSSKSEPDSVAALKSSESGSKALPSSLSSSSSPPSPPSALDRNDQPPSLKKANGSSLLFTKARHQCIPINETKDRHGLHDLRPGQIDRSLRSGNIHRIEPFLDCFEVGHWDGVDVHWRPRVVLKDENEIEILQPVLNTFQVGKLHL